MNRPAKKHEWFLLWLLSTMVFVLPLEAATTEGRVGLLSLGSAAPDFDLPDVVSGGRVMKRDFEEKPLLVVFLCRHCPYVQHVKGALAQVAKEYLGKGVGVVGVSANDAAVYPDDAPSSLAAFVKEEGFPFPVLYDETQAVALSYTAVATPDVFLFDKNHRLVYRGQFDDTRPGGDPATGGDIRAALDALLSGQPVPSKQKPAVGCSIKWKPGNHPSYA